MVPIEVKFNVENKYYMPHNWNLGHFYLFNYKFWGSWWHIYKEFTSSRLKKSYDYAIIIDNMTKAGTKYDRIETADVK